MPEAGHKIHRTLWLLSHIDHSQSNTLSLLLFNWKWWCTNFLAFSGSVNSWLYNLNFNRPWAIHRAFSHYNHAFKIFKKEALNKRVPGATQFKLQLLTPCAKLNIQFSRHRNKHSPFKVLVRKPTFPHWQRTKLSI